MLSRRAMLTGATALAGLGGAFAYFRATPSGFHSDGNVTFEVTRTDAEWKAVLTPDQFSVLRHEATERPGSSDLLAEKRVGTYHCAGCDLAAYRSEDKYDSGTGWPSFTRSIDNAVGTMVDYKILAPRTEVHCRRCGGHFGHIFDDGPKPTGKRHCLNGVALNFTVDV